MQSEVAYFNDPPGINQTIRGAQVAVKSNRRVVDVDDALQAISHVRGSQ